MQMNDAAISAKFLHTDKPGFAVAILWGLLWASSLF
jgi:hypothetical protein